MAAFTGKKSFEKEQANEWCIKISRLSYSACFIPDAVMNKKTDCDCAAFMIEINRRIFSTNSDFGIASKIREIIGQIVKEAVWI